MLTSNLRRVGGSTMLAVPPELLKILQLEAGDTVQLAIEEGRLVVAPQTRPRYTMAELLAASNYPNEQPANERELVDAPAVGRELL
ncbi:MAG: antitoxin [Thermomicrobiales bacterium]|nr:antitoxin [Thermomicrobiales bacterium]